MANLHDGGNYSPERAQSQEEVGRQDSLIKYGSRLIYVGTINGYVTREKEMKPSHFGTHLNTSKG